MIDPCALPQGLRDYPEDVGPPKTTSVDDSPEMRELQRALVEVIDRDFGGNASKLAEAIGKSPSQLTRIREGRRPRPDFLRLLARVVPDAVAAYVAVSPGERPRRPLWPHMVEALEMVGHKLDQRTVAYGRVLNDLWEVDRPVGEWVQALRDYQRAHAKIFAIDPGADQRSR